MAEAGRSSLLGSISPWGPRTGTPLPRSPRALPREETLKPSSGNDHLINLRPTPSLKKYPKDCPPLNTRWYYAVDVAKRKPFWTESSDDKKTPAKPKKWVTFSKSDSASVENAFQALDVNEVNGDTAAATSTKVPVNEDYLYDVHIEKRELEPAYWLGPIYEVRRGSWFYPESSGLKPCDENLAKQLEEKYIRVMPWRRQSHNRATSLSKTVPPTEDPSRVADKDLNVPEFTSSNTVRLFGAHMNTIVTYQDATTAYLSADDFMSRLGSTVYTRFGGQSGTKVVRGYAEPLKTTDARTTDIKNKRSSKQGPDLESARKEDIKVDTDTEPVLSRPSALERQISSLAGLAESEDEQRLAEEDAERAQEQEMEEARETEGEEQNRKIDHLILVTHGIGQRLGLRLDSINFVHDTNTLRKTLKGVYQTSPDLQALTGGLPRNSTVQVLPICWRHLLDFPKQSLKQNRKEFDLGDMDSALEDEYPSLQDITVEGVPAVRNLITDLAMDVLLYQSAYREHIASIVQKEANRIYSLFKKRSGFTGKVSLCGHSLGSAIIFDILCRQTEPGALASLTRPRRVSSKGSRHRASKETAVDGQNIQLNFPVENFFALGSPIALFQMLKGRTITARSILHDRAPVTSPFDPDDMTKDPFTAASQKSLIPITVSSPKCAELFNIFHPTDPIAYRMEPLISPAMARLKSQALPYVKKGLFDAPGLANMTARLGNSVMTSWYSLTSGMASSLINKSLGITGQDQALQSDKRQGVSLTSPQLPANSGVVASAAGGGAPIADPRKQQSLADAVNMPGAGSQQPETLIETEIETLYAGFKKQQENAKRLSDSSIASTTPEDTGMTDSLPTDLQQRDNAEKVRRLKREEAKVRALNSNGRVDYHIQEGMFDVSLLASIASHLSYWADEDVSHFMIGQMLKKGRRASAPDTLDTPDTASVAGVSSLKGPSGRDMLRTLDQFGDGGDLGDGGDIGTRGRRRM